LIALIDADVVAFRCAASAEHDPEEIAIIRTDKMMREILDDTAADTYNAYLSGQGNFRFEVYPDYKGNRKTMPQPKWRQACKDFLVKEWNAQVVNGMEADDALGIAQDKDSVICSNDKDLRQIPGKHYNFVTKEWDQVTQQQAYFWFYQQLILGDRSDNIPGFDGIMRATFPKKLQWAVDTLYACETEQEMFEFVFKLFEDNFNPYLERNGQLLYILKKENDKWDTKPYILEMERKLSSITETLVVPDQSTGLI